MTIVVGNRLPNAPILRVTNSEIETVDLNYVFAGRRVAIFGMPGAFTGTCSRAAWYFFPLERITLLWWSNGPDGPPTTDKNPTNR